MAIDSNIRDHKTWIGYLQPEGLVVSPAALVDAQVSLDLGGAAVRQRELEQYVHPIPNPDKSRAAIEPEVAAITDLARFLRDFLNWPTERLQGYSDDNPIPEELKIPLRDFGETLQPTYAFTSGVEPSADDPDASPWMLLVDKLEPGTPLDVPIESKLSGWSASPSRRFERLLRESGVPIGLLSNGTHLQLIYAPRGENAGRLTFPVGPMGEIPGRPIVAALEMLLLRYRLLAAPTKDRLPGILKRSRDYQARVSNTLSGQVLDALYEMLRGFQAADTYASGELLKEVLDREPDKVYQGLLTVLMRSVFLLYAEDQSLMPDSDLYNRNYSVHGLYQRLRNDHEQYPDTMESRYGAWAQLLALFRLVYSGNQHNLCKIPAREGHLFDPNRYPFLEGRREDNEYDPAQPLHLPLVPDGTIYRVLEKLLVLDGERLSYRTLDVEQIGSVYETMIGFGLETASGPTIALKPGKSHGAPVPISLTELLGTAPDKRATFIKEQTDYKLTTNMSRAVRAADSAEDLLASLENRIARSATPGAVPAGTMVLVPTDERRRSGSHYTPRSLTEPIVRTTLEPIFDQMGESPLPTQILDLKICDPAMGSGAFLVEACRQLAEKLVASWAAHGIKPYIPPDEDELLHARRLVAQRCLYGVDKNPMAVDLAKLSLWLTTLAKDHPFTFVDHSLRCGDSLVGLTRTQISSFHWDTTKKDTINRLGLQDREGREIEARIKRAGESRRAILDAGDTMLPGMKQQKLKLADEALNLIRVIGDACLSAFFSQSSKRARTERCDELFTSLAGYLADKTQFELRKVIDTAAKSLDEGEHPVTTFHWEIEFPEVFMRDSSGFDSYVGNPPFLGGARISTEGGMPYFAYLTTAYSPAGHQCDLVGYFFRQCFSKLQSGGALGLIATNTIAQGDTREGTLEPILRSGGTIFRAVRRLRWPGMAAVVVSQVQIFKGRLEQPPVLDSVIVNRISAYLVNGQADGSPARLSNSPYFSKGSQIYGQGFCFDDRDAKSGSILEMEEICRTEPQSKSRIFPFVGGEELNSLGVLEPQRYVIQLSDLQDEEELAAFPALEKIVRERVKPERDVLGPNPNNRPLKKRWWAYQAHRPELYERARSKKRLIAHAEVSKFLGFRFVPANWIYNKTAVIIDSESFGDFAVLQSRVHETWARTFASSMKDDMRYTASTCFATFVFPRECSDLNEIGESYFESRDRLMSSLNEGPTSLYNQFHSPEAMDERILELRAFQGEMDAAVLRAYGWDDLASRATCEFLLDYEEEEDEANESGRTSRRRKPYRYRWPDEFRDEVLARLLELNEQRAAEERATGAAAEAATKKKPKKKKTTTKTKPTSKTATKPKKTAAAKKPQTPDLLEGLE